MEDERHDFRKWDELLPDALGLIFNNLSLQEVLTVVPRVCKSWGRAVMDPYCWREIDIVEWSTFSKPENIDRMLQLLITRSCGSLRKLSVSDVASEQSIMFIANHAQSLRTLQLPRSNITDSLMGRVAHLLSDLTVLDLSHCVNIGAEGLQVIGKHCKFLSSLRRMVYPLEVMDKLSQDDEALAIAYTMPRLKHLEIPYLLVGTSSILEIINNCKDLEWLDVRGCESVDLDDKFVKKFPKLKVIGPLIYDRTGWDDCSDYSGSSGELDDDDYDDYDYDDYECDIHFWEDGPSLDDVEMRFYDDLNDVGYEWPRSP